MRTFNIPKMAVVHLSGEDVIRASLCDAKLCMGFDCPDCPTECTGIYHCDIFKCTTYDE